MTGQELQEQIDTIADGPELVVAAAAGVDDRTLGYKPSPDKWCILEILGHLADTFRRCEESGEIPPSDAADLVRLASKLSAWLRGLS